MMNYKDKNQKLREKNRLSEEHIKEERSKQRQEHQSESIYHSTQHK